jgi:hypothetical protein
LFQSFGLEKWVSSVRDHHIDGESLTYLESEADLLELGVAAGEKASFLLQKVSSYKERGKII